MMCRAPSELLLEGNVSKNWQTFKQKFEIYLEASNKAELDDKKKVAILLNLAGDKALKCTIPSNSAMKRTKASSKTCYRCLKSIVAQEKCST